MSNINRTSTADTPDISFDNQSKTLHISGNSYPENCSQLYAPIIDFIADYNVAEHRKLSIQLYFDLINSTSIVYMSKLMMKVSDLKKLGLEVKVSWSYDQFDDELLDLGEKLSSISELEFEYIPIKD